MIKINDLIIVLLLFITIGCSRKEANKNVVARLDNRTLTLEEIRTNTDTSMELSDAQIQQYIQRWLIEETLYREAVKRGLDRTEEVNKKIEGVRKQLSINALLDREIYAQGLINFSEQDIKQYYDVHIKEFNLTNDVVLVSYALFKDRDAATQFRNLVLKGINWRDAIEQMLSSVLGVVDSSYENQASLRPPELWRVAVNAIPREISFPINTKNGYYVLVVWKTLKRGQPADLMLVREEINNRLTVERRQKLFENFVDSLRSRHSIEVYFGSVTDSTKPRIK